MRIGVQMSNIPWLGSVSDIVILNYDIVGKFAEKIAGEQWDLRITDESHYLKNPKAKRTKLTLGIQSRRKLSLTGTPILNRPVELFPIISDLDPKSWDPKKGFFKFARRYCDARQNGFGWDFSGHSHEQELQEKLRSTCMVRRLKADVLVELPPKRRQVIELPTNGHASLVEQENETWAAREDRMAELQARVQMAKASEDRGEYEAAVEALREGQGALFAEMAKIRHQVALAKLEQCEAFIEDAIESGKVIVFCHHLDVAARLKEKFSQAAVITGETKSENRMPEVDRFQNDPACNVFIGNHAAKEGLTLTASSHVIFVEGDWVPGNLCQMEDRAHRIGQTNSVLVTHLVLEGSLDAVMLQRVIEKQITLDKCLDKIAAAAELNEPAPVEKGPIKSVSVTFEEIEKAAPTIKPETTVLAHQGMRMLAGMCDGAEKLDGCGFSKIDAHIGHSFAGQSSLSAKQAVIAVKLCRKYVRQLGREFVERLS